MFRGISTDYRTVSGYSTCRRMQMQVPESNNTETDNGSGSDAAADASEE